MRRSYDPMWGSREQLKDSHESGMQLRREVDALKKENKELLDQITELKALVKYITEGE